MIKNWKIAGFLAVLLLALSGLATWDEWKTKQEEKGKETENKLFTLKAEDVTGFMLHYRPDANEGGDKTVKSAPTADPTKVTDLTVKLVDGKWMLTSPVSEIADQQTVQDMIKNVLDYKYEKEVTSGKDQWGQYGLNDPRRRITLETKDGAKTEFLVGINAPVGYSIYVATANADKVYAGSQYVATSTAKTLFDFRDKKILSINTADLASVELTHGKDKPLTLIRKDGKWSITSPESAEADATQVNNFLDDVSGLRAAEFVDAPTKDQIAAFAKGKLFAHLRLTTTKGDVQELNIASIKESLYAAFDPGKRVIKLGEDAKGKLAKTLNDLRNKKIFDFQSTQVDRIDIDNREFVRVKDEWYAKDDSTKFDKDGKFTGKETEKPAAKQNIRGLLVDLEYAKADAIMNDAEVKKLPPAPKNRIKLNFASSSSRPELTIDIWKAGDNPEQIYVRPSGNPKVFKVKASIIASMNDAPKLPAEDASFVPQDASPSGPTN